MSQSPVIMRVGSTLAVFNIWMNLIDCCKPILARRRPDGAARRLDLDSRGCRGLLLLAGPEQHAQVQPVSTLTAADLRPYRSKALRHKLTPDAVLTAFRQTEDKVSCRHSVQSRRPSRR